MRLQPEALSTGVESRDQLARVIQALPCLHQHTDPTRQVAASPWEELLYGELRSQVELSSKLGPSSLKSQSSQNLFSAFDRGVKPLGPGKD